MKRKGFTLIELLAVILILGIIALIAVPAVTKIIDNAKKGAAKSSALNYAKAINNQVMLNSMTGNNVISDGTYTPDELKAKGVDMKGTLPSSGTITIINGEVSAYNVSFNGYEVSMSTPTGEVSVSKAGAYPEYRRGYAVKRAGETTEHSWYVYRTSGSDSKTVELISRESYGDTSVTEDGKTVRKIKFDTAGNDDWDVSSAKTYVETTVKQQIESTYGFNVKNITIADGSMLRWRYTRCGLAEEYGNPGIYMGHCVSPDDTTVDGGMYGVMDFFMKDAWTKINVYYTDSRLTTVQRTAGKVMIHGVNNMANNFTQVDPTSLHSLYPVITVDKDTIQVEVANELPPYVD